MKFKKFISIWLIGVVALTMALVAVGTHASRLSSPDSTQGSVASSYSHFCVVWQGFVPVDYWSNSYSNQTPDYYFCINDLNVSILQMNIALRIQNYENRTLWYTIGPYTTPPAGWTVTTLNIGQINQYATDDFVYSNLARVKPTSIPQGELVENISLVVKAFNDAGLTQFYSQDTFNVTYHFIDRTATVWTVHEDNFDDGTGDGWGGYGDYVAKFSICRSYPCSFSIDGGVSKTFDTSGPYSEAYLIFALYHNPNDPMIVSVNGVTVYVEDSNVGPTGWYQYTVSLPISGSVIVSIGNAYGYLDNVYLISK